MVNWYHWFWLIKDCPSYDTPHLPRVMLARFNRLDVKWTLETLGHHGCIPMGIHRSQEPQRTLKSQNSLDCTTLIACIYRWVLTVGCPEYLLGEASNRTKRTMILENLRLSALTTTWVVAPTTHKGSRLPLMRTCKDRRVIARGYSENSWLKGRTRYA